MEEFSRRALVALAVAAAGPGAAMLTLLMIGPSLVAAAVPGTGGGIVETLGSTLVGVLIGGTLSVILAYVVGALATLVAFTATRCPRPYIAWIVCLALSPVWMAVLSSFDLDAVGFVVLMGMLPGALRLGFGYAALPRSGTGELRSAASEST